MNNASEPVQGSSVLREKLLGAGLETVRKSYYPALQAQVRELRQKEQYLQEQSQALLKTVSDLQQARREIEKREARFRGLIETAPVVILVLDRQGHILEFNSEAERAYGHSRHEVLGQNYFELFLSEEVRELVKDECRRVLAGEAACGYENAIKTADGSERVFSWHADRLVDEMGETIGIIAVGLEITARKQAEEQVRDLNQELEERVALRTRELELANQELEAFTYMASHDLRAPLRHISTFAEMLQQATAGTLGEENQMLVHRIRNNASRMTALIGDLLNFSRAGRAKLSRVSVDVGELVREIQQELRPDWQERNVAWEIERLPVVYADRPLLHQVLMNLLANALKYTKPRTEARIRIGARETDAEHVLSVRDNGVGFPCENIGRLFQPFQRLHSEQEFAGSGIGLAIVARIINRHGGKVWAEGAPGEGACFCFTLPKT